MNRPRFFSPSNRTNLTRWAIPVGLFLLTLAVRLPALDRFLTPDEFLWVDRSRNFLLGILNPAYVCRSPANHTGFEQAVGLACTLRTGHPGVTTMWTGSIGILLRYVADGMPGTLLDYVRALGTNPLDPRLIAPVRLPTILLTSLWVAIIYWVVRRLLGDWRVALVGGLLVALDPFQVAYSRVIHHDMLETIFMTTAFLAALIYWGQGASRKWLVLSGGAAGFAFLSKSPSLVLIPFFALLGLWSLFETWRSQGSMAAQRRLWPAAWDGLYWFGSAATVFVAFWPAMWIIPADALQTIFFIGTKYATEGHAKGNYFMGTISPDPGVFFYPVTWLLRSSPLIWLGLIAAALVGGRRRQERYQGVAKPAPTFPTPEPETGSGPAPPFRRLLPWLAIYVLLFVLVLTILGGKKQERYIVPIFPIVSIIAATGLTHVFRSDLHFFPLRWRPYVPRFGLAVVLAIVVLVQGQALVASYPYYLTWYNPLLGGGRGAARMVTIGWGEGLDLAAQYLNQKPDAEDLRVSSWYQSTFAPYFKGEAISYSQEKGKAMAGEYVVLYVNQWQRRFPDDEFYRYFETRYQPETVISISGVDYVAIYPGPGIRHYVEDRVDENRRVYRGIAALLGWDWPQAANPDRPLVSAGGALPFRLYWEFLGKVPEESFFLRLVGPDGLAWAEGTSLPESSQNGDPATWRQGQIITEAGQLPVPPGTPPGDYRLEIGFYTQAPAVATGELLFDLPPEEAWVRVVASPVQHLDDLPLNTRLGASLGDLTLLGVDLLGDIWLARDQPWHLDLYWQVTAPPETDYQVQFSLVDNSGQTRWAWDAGPLVDFYPTTHWSSGDVVRSQMTLTPGARMPGGEYDLSLTLLDGTGRAVGQVDVGSVQVAGRTRSFELPRVQTEVGATFGDELVLAGYILRVPHQLTDLGPGDQLVVELIWQALAPLKTDYTVTVQLLGPDGKIYAQHDAAPLDGDVPTSAWTPGEVLRDSHQLTLASAAPPGTYQLLVGLYDFDSGQRLQVEDLRPGMANFDTVVVLQQWSTP